MPSPSQVVFEERQFNNQSIESSYNVFTSSGVRGMFAAYGPHEDMLPGIRREPLDAARL